MSFTENLEQLKAEIGVAEDEIMMAVMFHETWKPMAYDESLRERMGNSYATHSFQIIRTALRREKLLSIWKLWDSNTDAVRLTTIAERVRQKDFFEELVTLRATGMGLTAVGIRQAVHETLKADLDKILALVRKYQKDGTGFGVRSRLGTLRNERLAHRQKKSTTTATTTLADEEMEEFYADNLEIIRLLNSLVLGKAFDLVQATDVYRHHAKFFWINARGERTEGHPNYFKPRE